MWLSLTTNFGLSKLLNSFLRDGDFFLSSQFELGKFSLPDWKKFPQDWENRFCFLKFSKSGRWFWIHLAFQHKIFQDPGIKCFFRIFQEKLSVSEFSDPLVLKFLWKRDEKYRKISHKKNWKRSENYKTQQKEKLIKSIKSLLWNSFLIIFPFNLPPWTEWIIPPQKSTWEKLSFSWS